MIKTGSYDLDLFLDGGYKKGEITLIYGGSATGKTTLALMAALECAKNNKRCFFIDTEKGFSMERIKQIDENVKLDNIFVVNVKDFKDQCDKVEEVVKIANKGVVDLIVIDSLGIHYRSEKRSEVNIKLANQLKILSWVAREKNIPIVVTNQVYTHFDEGIKPVGGNMVMNWSKCLIKLEKDLKRKCFLEKPIKKEIAFDIYDKGIKQI